MQSNLKMIQVQVFIDAEDIYDGRSLHEYIMRYLLHHKIHGATMFTGTMGFGAHHHLHHPEQLAASDSQPIMITFVDEASLVNNVIPHLKSVVKQGLIIAHEVNAL